MSNNTLKELYIPLPWVVAIIASMVGVVASASIGHYRLGKAEDALNDHKVEAKTLEAQDHKHDLELKEIKGDLKAISGKLDSISKKLDR